MRLHDWMRKIARKLEKYCDEDDSSNKCGCEHVDCLRAATELGRRASE